MQPAGAKVLGTVVGEGRGDKILVFHLKRKKQYKKLQGHRQGFTQVRIDSIQVDGKNYAAKKRALGLTSKIEDLAAWHIKRD